MKTKWDKYVGKNFNVTIVCPRSHGHDFLNNENFHLHCVTDISSVEDSPRGK